MSQVYLNSSDYKELTNEVSNRFALILTLSIFLPILLYYLAIAISKTDGKAAEVLLESSSLVGIYLLDYILFQTQKIKTTEKSLKRINNFLLISMIPIVIFILSAGLGVAVQNAYIESILAIFLVSSIFILLASPIVLEFLILWGSREK